MHTNSDKIKLLMDQIELIKKRQNYIAREIIKIEAQIEAFKEQGSISKITVSTQADIITSDSNQEASDTMTGKSNVRPESLKRAVEPKKLQSKSEVERFIGENLLSVIGILVLVIGISIGVKYAIDKDLISPLSRVLLGYAAGVLLLFTAFALKNKFQNLSAVVLSGSMASMYFISFVAYDFYNLLGMASAFIVMIAITVGTVTAALRYNKQIIAHLGLVGAYAVPFLLGDEQGRAISLFSLIAIINIGILVVAIRKYWRLLYYSAFFFTWLIFLIWYASAPDSESHSFVTPLFAGIYFVIFYGTFLFYKIIRKEQFRVEDIISLLLNVFIYFGVGYSYLDALDYSQRSLAIFTAGNALIHGVISILIYNQSNTDPKIKFLISGLAFLFATLAVPVYWDGNWVTLIWIGEAVLVYWIGVRQSNVSFKNLAYAISALALISLIHDWGSAYSGYYNEELRFTSFVNIHFISSLLCCGALLFISQWPQSTLEDTTDSVPAKKRFDFSSLLLIIAVVVLYLSIFYEISYFWEKKYILSLSNEATGDAQTDPMEFRWDYKRFKSLWLQIFTMCFLTCIIFLNIKQWKSLSLSKFYLVVSAILLLIFLSAGLYDISQLRDIYLGKSVNGPIQAGIFHLMIRYVVILSAGGMIYAVSNALKAEFNTLQLSAIFDLSFSLFLLGILSSELYHWMDVMGTHDFHKLGLSIFWGIFAVSMVVLGIYRKKQYLRVAAIVLFSITLMKLFFYDIGHLSTISRTIVFVSLGVLLLVISFLYTKYKHLILEDTDNK